MRYSSLFRPLPSRAVRMASLLLAGVCATGPLAAQADPRATLSVGFRNAGEAIRHLEHVAHVPKQAGWFNPQEIGSFDYALADLAFQRNLVFQGGWHGWQAWDISNPKAPTLRKAFVCQGGQGDLSIHGTLLFMSVEDPSGRVDCGTQGVSTAVSAERFLGVRIFDISDLDHPQQVAAVQTCRGSHTHTLVTDAKDPAHVYLYVQGTGPVRSPQELPGCTRAESDTATALFRIEVIKVPVADPARAAIVNMPRLFADAAGNVAGLWKGGSHGEGTQTTSRTDQCHDITVYPAIGLGAGACSGNGILLDISDPANPKRLHEVIDPNFAYWHSATFNNAGTSVLFTDEWGGGVAPRCRATDKATWGANALFTLGADRTLRQVGYYKIPTAQGANENCVAHNGSLIPVPGRDIMVQAWYQGGISVFDFTDPAHPVEIAYFDRGPIDEALTLAGFWSAYWYNGHIVGSEIGRGLDLFALQPSEFLTRNEIEAAKLVTATEVNPQLQTRITWPAHVTVARAYLDQLTRGKALPAARLAAIGKAIDTAEGAASSARKSAYALLAAQLDGDAARSSDAPRVRLLREVLRAMAR